MQIGIFPVGLGLVADPELITLFARTAEHCGFHSLWAGEHVVFLKDSISKYPYAQGGVLPLPSTKIPLLDPLAALTFAAAHTKTLRLGTGVYLVPERHPVVTAKQIASLDVLCGGRFDFGVGIGWLAEEFAAVGVPWERRAARTLEYLTAMKLLWTEEEPEFKGEFCNFPTAYLYPKPVQKPHPPIIFGGNSTPALRRVAEAGDGWFGWTLTAAETTGKIEQIRRYARAVGRDPEQLQFSVSAGFAAPVDLDEVKRYRDAGVHQVIFASLPSDPKDIQGHIERLAEQIVVPAAKF
ncbi:MAG: LLM class F420-dependent oxidoreductase [Candidatus Binatia bacterium]